MQNTKTFDWMLAHFPSCGRSERATQYYSANWLWRVTHVILAMIRLSYHIHLAILSYSNMEIYFGINQSS